MIADERQALLDEHGLVEDAWGSLTLGTLRGLQRGAERALRLREAGNEETARILRLPPYDPLRIRFLEALQIEAFAVDLSNNSRGF